MRAKDRIASRVRTVRRAREAGRPDSDMIGGHEPRSLSCAAVLEPPRAPILPTAMTHRFARLLRSAFAVSVLALPIAACTPASEAAGRRVATGEIVTGIRQVPIHVVSTRKLDAKGNVTGEVSQRPRYLVTGVGIPPGHRPGVIERPSMTTESRNRHFTVLGQRAVEESDFFGEIATQLSGRVGVSRDVLVFVHGFNTGFDEARFRLAQVVTDSGFTGVPVLFTWPSRTQLLAYGSDKESATASRDALETLIRSLSEVQGVGRVHVLAHSMGTWLAMEALRQNAIAGRADLGGRLGEIILAAPDIDLDVFRAQMARLGRVTRVSVFAARDDRALSVSSAIAGSRTRLGALDLNDAKHREEIGKLGVRVYDLTAAEMQDYFRHGGYAEAPQVVRAIGSQLAEPKFEDRQAQGFVDDEAVKAAQAPAPTAVISAPLPAPEQPAR